MSYVYTYLNVTQKLISEYTPPQPFHLYLKKYFSQNKKHGSRDRKTITALCYAYYRTGKNFVDLSVEDKTLLSFSLIKTSLFNEAWQLKLKKQFPSLPNNFTELALNKQLDELEQHYKFNTAQLFPFTNKLSKTVDAEAFSTSLLVQPNVWLRAKKNKKEKVEQLLVNSGITPISHPEVSNAIGSKQQFNIEQVLGKNHHHFLEVQDASSQQTGSFIQLQPLQKVWDCCCGAGGKSLMAKDLEPKIELYCSDIRPQIIQNLKERFKLSGIAAPFETVSDISQNSHTEIVFETKSERKTATKNYFDAIIADVPCTGSGTWARTPEQAFYFDEKQVDEFAKKQKSIVANAVSFLKKGGALYYITCSVFEEENEAQLPYFETLGLTVKQNELIKGYNHKADSMFIAVLEKV